MTREAIPTDYLDLFEKRAFGHLATLMPDGSPHVTPVWVDFDGSHVLVNTAAGRQKERNITDDARVALDIPDPDNPYRYLMVRGRAVRATDKDADAHIDKMAQKYLDEEVYPFRAPGEVRVLYKIEPDHVVGSG